MRWLQRQSLADSLGGAAWLFAIGLMLTVVAMSPAWGHRLLGLPYGQSRLWHAVGTGHLGELDRAIAEGSSVNAANPWGMTALVLAAAGEDSQIVRGLLRCGADPNRPSELGITPLYSAVLREQTESVQVLLEAGADPNRLCPIRARVPALGTPRTPLMAAARQGNQRIVELLIAAGAEVNPNQTGPSPLRVAVESGHPHLAELLRRHGAQMG